MRIRSILVLVFVIAGCGPKEATYPAASDEGTPTPEESPEPTSTPLPDPPACEETRSFEVPDAPDSGASFIAYTQGATIDGFYIEAGSIDVVGTYWQAACGVQSIDLSGNPGAPGTISREFPTTPGAQHVLRFAMAGNPYDSTIQKVLRVFWEGGQIAELEWDSDDFSEQNMGWKFRTFTLTASGSTARVRFQSLTPDAYGPAIDAVSVTPIP